MTWCWLGLHKYSKWVDGNIYTLRIRNIEKGQLLVQVRTCAGCGAKQSREVSL